MTRFAQPRAHPFLARVGALALSLAFPLALAGISLAAASTASAAPIQCGDDGFEDNDSCGAAVPITAPFSAFGLVTYKLDNDYFKLTVPPGMELTVDLVFSHFTADIDLFVYDLNGPCGGILTYLDRSVSSNDDESLSWINTGSTPVEVAIKVLVFPGSIAPCNTYDIQVNVLQPIDPCNASVSDDGFEENDMCASAFPAPDGLTQDLWVSRDDPDFWSFTVQPGEAIDATIFFSDVASDLDMYLYDIDVSCGGGFGTGELASAFTQTDNERIIWTNTGSAARNLVLEVNVFVSGSCTNYDLSIDIAGGGIGTNYCLANPNSSGVIGLISAAGTPSTGQNNLRLSADQLPPDSFGFFLGSRTQAFVPNAGGSDGNLCLGGSVGRFNDQIQNSGGGGRIAINVDLSAVPQPNGSITANAGETWHFQAWHRDTGPGGNVTSNLSNAIRVILTN